MSKRSWVERSLGEIASFEYGSALPAGSRTGDEIPVFGSNGEVGRHHSALVQGPGIVVGRKGTVGALTWSDSDFWPIDTAYYVRAGSSTDLRWLFWMLSTLGLGRLDSSTGVPGLNRNDAYELKLLQPSRDEQRQVAEILDTLDDQIRATERVAAKLKIMKSALYQAVFSNGELPMTPLGSVTEVRNGTTPSRSRADYWDSGTVAWLASGKVNEYRIRSCSELVTERAASECNLRILPPGSVVVGMIGQGKTRGMAARIEIDAAINQNLAGIIPGPRLRGDYVHHYLVNSYQKLRSGGRGSNQDALTTGLVLQFMVPVPELDEQRRVAGLLDSVDQQIDSGKEVLWKLTRQKEGLLGDLLSGRVRIPTEAAS